MTRTTVKSTPLPTLGQAQQQLERATKALKECQDNFVSAETALHLAEEAHAAATTALLNELRVVRGRNKVSPVELR